MRGRHCVRSFSIALCVAALGWSGSTYAALFNIVYDDFDDQLIGSVVGTGTFGYDGLATAGNFALSTLTNISFNASFVTGESFTTSDLITDLTRTRISVFDPGGGELGLVFTGSGGLTVRGSLEAEDSNGRNLSHEPTRGAIGDPTGCCGGNGTISIYVLGNAGHVPVFVGDYSARVATLPEPSGLILMGIGLTGITFLRKRSRKHVTT